MRTAVITLSQEGARVAARLARRLEDACLYVHDSAGAPEEGFPGARMFGGVMELTAEIFHRCDALVYVAPCGVAVRATAAHLRDKREDPAVVVVDVGGRYAVSLAGGHEGGANELALRVANIIGAEPVITTTTEALKDLIVGVGCRRGVKAEKVTRAVEEALELAGGALSRVRWLASADIKAEEEGLIEAAARLGIPLRFISSQEIRSAAFSFTRSEFVEKQVNLPAVAEPAALLAGRRTRLILPRTVMHGVTVAVARESFLWSE